MEHHGAESYYVLGEGLLTESGGGAPGRSGRGRGADAAVPLLADGAAGGGASSASRPARSSPRR